MLRCAHRFEEVRDEEKPGIHRPTTVQAAAQVFGLQLKLPESRDSDADRSETGATLASKLVKDSPGLFSLPSR